MFGLYLIFVFLKIELVFLDIWLRIFYFFEWGYCVRGNFYLINFRVNKLRFIEEKEIWLMVDFYLKRE